MKEVKIITDILEEDLDHYLIIYFRYSFKRVREREREREIDEEEN